MTCIVCNTEMRAHGDEYAECGACGYWGSLLPVDAANTSAPDSEYELVSYEHTRRGNYGRILDLLARRHGKGARLLELGCADGLFLTLARERGYQVLGIEPNAKMEAGNRDRHQIRRGYFPDAVDVDERFDIIALNCVFEHIPDVHAIVGAFTRHLERGGSVMLNIPVASGAMFKIARAAYAAGVRYPFDRLWQKGFVSPHVHFFTAENLAKLLRAHGYELVSQTPLAFFSLGGINARLSLDPHIKRAQRLLALGGLAAYYPASRMLPDARAFVFALGAA